MRNHGLRFRWIVLIVGVGTRRGDGMTEAARCGIGGKGRGGLCQWFQWGGQWMIK